MREKRAPDLFSRTGIGKATESKGDARDVMSLQLKRMVSGLVAVTAVIAVVSFNTPAIADPAPAPENASEALKAYRALQSKAEKINEEHLKAQDALTASQKNLRKANSDLKQAKKSEAAARADEAKVRKVVDRFAGASYVGTRFDGVSAALNGDSVQDFLQKSAAIDVLAAEKNDALGKLTRAVKQAQKAQSAAADAGKRARDSRDAAAKSKADIESRKRALDGQIQKAKQAYDQLSGADRAAQESTYGEEGPVPSNIKAPGPAAQTAIDAAMSQRGKPYSYGAEGPDAYDCSGLTMWSYNKAGVSLPRSSSQQATTGAPVIRAQLQPGDLVFFYNPVSHVGIYIGDGQMVHAPQSGDVVKVAPVMWDDFNSARRVA